MQKQDKMNGVEKTLCVVGSVFFLWGLFLVTGTFLTPHYFRGGQGIIGLFFISVSILFTIYFEIYKNKKIKDGINKNTP
jgi:hypothetical protein